MMKALGLPTSFGSKKGGRRWTADSKSRAAAWRESFESTDSVLVSITKYELVDTSNTTLLTWTKSKICGLGGRHNVEIYSRSPFL